MTVNSVTTCPSCGAPAQGRYCADCGQDQRPVARRWRSYGAEFLDLTLSLDSSTLKSIWTLIRRPGALSRLKVANQSSELVSPIKLFFVTLVFYGLFFGLSPVHYGEVRFGTDLELYGFGDPRLASSEFLFFSSGLSPEKLVQPGLLELLRAGEAEGLEGDQAARILALADNPLEAERLQARFSSLVPYGVLALVPPVLVFGMLIYRRRYVVEHFFVALEATTQYLLLTIVTGVGVFVLRTAGFMVGEYEPFLFFMFPAAILWMAATLRGFYAMRRVFAVPAALAILVVYWVLDGFITEAFVVFALSRVTLG